MYLIFALQQSVCKKAMRNTNSVDTDYMGLHGHQSGTDYMGLHAHRSPLKTFRAHRAITSSTLSQSRSMLAHVTAPPTAGRENSPQFSPASAPLPPCASHPAALTLRSTSHPYANSLNQNAAAPSTPYVRLPVELAVAGPRSA